MKCGLDFNKKPDSESFKMIKINSSESNNNC